MTSLLWLTIDWREADTDVPEAQQEQFTEVLFRELNGFDEVERVERVADPTVPDGGMGAAWLWGILTAEVSVANLKRLGKEVGVYTREGGRHRNAFRSDEFIVEPQSGLKLRHSRFS